MQQVTQVGAFTNATQSIINNLLQNTIGVTTGNVYYLDPVNGLDTNSGLATNQAVQSLSAAYGLCTSGNNDVVVLMGNGLASGSARISSGFTWSKNATHLLGVCSGTRFSPRARIAPPTTATAFANFFTVSGSGCLFSNIEWFHGFGTGVAAEVCMTITGSRNKFIRCAFSGMGDTTGATDTGSRNLILSGGGEHDFVECTIGIDTVTRTGANASVEFKSGTVRNTFQNCYFPIYQGAGGASLIFYTAAAAACDRWQWIQDCYFLNAIESGATTETDLSTMAAASGGGLFFRDCTICGITNYGHDATTRGQIRVDGGAPAANTTISQTGIAVQPNA